MEIDTKAIREMMDEGITADTHHATVKSEYEKRTGHRPNGDSYQKVKEALVEAEENSDEDLVERGREIVRERIEDPDQPDYWRKVTDVSEVNDDGNPTRVVIECQDPQEDKDGIDVCAGTREIATQDLFQVERCDPCQSEYNRKYRAKKARERRRRKKAEA